MGYDGIEEGVNMAGGEVLSHLISLDTCHPASLKQSLTLVSNLQHSRSCGTCKYKVHHVHTEYIGNPKTNISDTWQDY